MEDTFRVRVDKAFGSLESSSTTAPSSLSSLWSLTDEEIERIEWDRQRDSPEDTEPKPYPSKFDGFVAKLENLAPPGKAVSIPEELEADLNELSEGDESTGDEEDEAESDEDGGKGKKPVQLTKPDDHDDEEWDIRSSIGLDCTLDNEEEEDEFDKTAIGSEVAADRVYMKDITGNRADDIGFYDELPDTFEDAARDPRANHTAAKLRLIQDSETAGKFDSLRVSDNNLEDNTNLKSILKRKEKKQVDPKSEKRVRFDPECNDDDEEEEERSKGRARDAAMQSSLPSEASFQAAVPDYIRNPSKYKHYTFDSLSDLDEESNSRACMDFFNQLMKSNGSEQPDDSPFDLRKPITFTPRKKPNDVLMKNGSESSIAKKGVTISIAAEEFQGSEVCDMEEDEPVAEAAATRTSGSQKQGRRYRSKADMELISE